MRAMAAVVLVMGCAGASAAPLSASGPASDGQSVQRNKVEHPSESPPSEASAAPPSSSASAPLAASAVALEQPLPTPDKGASKVALLSAGAEPRKLLRYVFHRGQSSSFRLRTDMTMDTTVVASGVSSAAAPRVMHQILPTTECTGVTHTRLVDADGTAHRDGALASFTALTTPGVLPEVQTKVEQMLRGVGKIPFDDVIDPRGQISDSHMDLSSVREPTMLESMQRTAENVSALTVPWPVEAVGVGAKWQVLSTFGARGQFARDVTVSFTAVQGAKIKLEMTVNVTGTPSSIVKNGIAIEVGPTTSTGTAHLELTLEPMTNQSKSSTHTSTTSTTNGVQIQMKIDTETDYRSGP